MRAHDESLFWMKDDNWSRMDRERDCLELTPEAPQRAAPQGTALPLRLHRCLFGSYGEKNLLFSIASIP